MSEWRAEFQYLLDRKILSRDELGYLFGQIKSLIDNEKQAAVQHIYNLVAKITNKKYGPYCGSRGYEEPQWFDILKKEVEHLQAENKRLKADLEKHRWIPVSERLPEEYITVMVAGGIARYVDGVWWTGMEEPLYQREIKWEVTHWKPITLTKEK